LRVVINAQLDPKRSGGIAQVILGLAHSLGELDGPEEYVFVCSQSSAQWLESYVGPNSRIEVNTKGGAAPADGVRQSDGFWESFSPNVLHFPYQSYTRTEIPTVFNPHDLQHVHLPQMFKEEERARRERLYGEACRLSAAIVTTSQFVKNDVVRQYEVTPDNVHVVWWGPPSAAYERPSNEAVARVLAMYDIPARFAIYPAQTWPHKNHKLLLEALHSLRTRDGVIVPLVCTGAKTEHYSQLAHYVEQLGMADQVSFLGWVDEGELIALYHSAEMMIVPTLFEAISFPVFEAFAEGIPVACSTVTSLPEQVGDAALLFDPNNVMELTSVILMLHKDEQVRRELIERGHTRLAQFTWKNAAEGYRAVYRGVAGLSPTPCSTAEVGVR